MKRLSPKKPPKQEREKQLLLGLVDLFIRTGKPIGSATLKEAGFSDISSATIRNYFAKLEEAGFLKQHHSSGGRVPTHLAYTLYAESLLLSGELDFSLAQNLSPTLGKENRNVALYLEQAASTLSEVSGCATFFSAPKFDQDFITDIKLIALDHSRALAILISDFGFISTVTLQTEKKLSSFSLKRIEAYFRWKMTQIDKPILSKEEELLAHQFYTESMLQKLVSSSQSSLIEVHKTGFSTLLRYHDFSDLSSLVTGLSLFDDPTKLHTFLKEAVERSSLQFWIGGDLQNCSVIAIPYRVGTLPVGAIAILGPNRIPYQKLFGLMEEASKKISDSLTKTLYKFKITLRKAEKTVPLTIPYTTHLLEHDHE